MEKIKHNLQRQQKAIQETEAELLRFQNYSALDMRGEDAIVIDRLTKKLERQRQNFAATQRQLASYNDPRQTELAEIANAAAGKSSKAAK